MVAPIHTIQPSFAGGEFAPSLQSRVDIQKYQTGAKRLRNFIVHPHGGISNRPGTKYVATAKYGNKKCRLIPFKFSTTQSYVIELGEYYCRFYTNGGQIAMSSATAWATTTAYVVGDYVSNSGTIYYCLIAHTSGTFATDLAAGKWVAQTIYEIPTPYAEADLPDLYFTQSADVLFIAHPDYAPRTLSRITNTDWNLELYDFVGGPFMLSNTDTTKNLKSSAITGSVTLTATGWTFNADHVGALFQLRHYIEGQSVSQAFSGAATSSSIKCGGTWRFITHGTWTGTIKLEKSTDGGTTWTMLRQFTSANDFNANTYGTEDMSDDAQPFLMRMNCTSLTGGTCNADLSTDPFTQIGVAKITSVAVGGATAVATVQREVGIANVNTVDWAEGSWSTYRGWPAVVEFIPQDRLVFANTKTEPQTTWMTRAGNYYTFTRSTPLVDSDGITVNLPSREVNAINGLIPFKKMLAFTSSSEWSIGATSGNILSPSTVNQDIEGYEGSSGVRPMVIGNRAIYVSSMGSVIRDLGYQLAEDGFIGNEISTLANHLFTGYSIIELAYQQNPDRLVWAVRNDGMLLAMTYMREQEVIAWTWHDTDGLFESVCCIPASTYSELWMAVKRGNSRFIERMAQRMPSTDPEDQFFVDCGITYDGAPAQVISGLDHLEGKTVSILADGNVIAQKTVSSGSIDLGAEYSLVHVGLAFTADLETLNVDFALADGTVQGRKVKISSVTFKLLNSRGGWIGPDSDSLMELNYGKRTTYGTALTLVTDDVKANLGGYYTDGGRMFFRQSDPLPVTILALIPTITVGGSSDR